MSTSESSSVSESSNISNQQVPSAGTRQYDAASDATFVLRNLITVRAGACRSSVCHPYGLLNAGPLIAFGFAMSLLPFLIAATLRLFDAIAAREHSKMASRSLLSQAWFAWLRTRVSHSRML